MRLGEAPGATTAANAAAGSASALAAANGSYSGTVTLGVPGLVAGDSNTAMSLTSGNSARMAVERCASRRCCS